MDANKLTEFLEFRIGCLQEELDELKAAQNGDDAVDALIDLSVFAIGTLDLFGIDAEIAWNRVYAANISKEVGIKEARPNPLGLPDLIKPEGWTAPTHVDNIGAFEKIYD
jgi:predicted HAD superfamily Cof-like phosphohydrolase